MFDSLYYIAGVSALLVICLVPVGVGALILNGYLTVLHNLF